MLQPVKDVLVLCTGNSCRSIMGEALINHLRPAAYRAASAGAAPTGRVHPRAVETLRRHGIDPGDPRSKSWDELAGRHFDLVITVCDRAASEACPAFTGRCEKRHWSIPDPASAQGTEQEIDQAFENAFRMLAARIEQGLP